MKAANYLEGKPGDTRSKEILFALKQLKLDEVEVDVTSTKIELQEELSLLRKSIENGGAFAGSHHVQAASAPPLAPAPVSTNTGSNQQDLQKIRELEGENAKLMQKVEELKSDLANSLSQQNNQTAKLSSSNSEEINKLRKEIDSLNQKLKETNSLLQERDNEIQTLQNNLQNTKHQMESNSSHEKHLQQEIEKYKTLLHEEKASRNQLKIDLEKQSQQKIQEITNQYENKLQSKEEEWNAEREEMEVALAQELEEVEKGKDEEIAVLMEENAQLTKKYKSLQTANANLFSNLRKLNEKSKGIKAEFSKKFNASFQDDINDMKKLVSSGSTILTKIKNFTNDYQALNKKYLREMNERKKLHNLVQELKGNIRVYLRCRPPTTKEIENFGNDSVCVSFPNPGEIKVFNSEKNREKVWEFDEVFDPNTTQEQVYQDVSALVTSVLDGYNVCIFAYGQTGSGKTHTMAGNPSNPGVNTRALEELFIRARERSGEWTDSITVSILEVYNEEIRDLLNEKGEEKLEVKMGEFGNYVPGLTHIPVSNIDQVLQLMQKADRVRSSATTNMNEHSSRSHMMLTVTVVSEFLPTRVVTRGKLNLVDLAGSERINKSGAQGQALKEAQNINKSLFALGDVIAARAQKNSHIPFRNSTLTFLLQDSLSQDSKTLMIVCISPILYNCEETYCSLNFAAK